MHAIALFLFVNTLCQATSQHLQIPSAASLEQEIKAIEYYSPLHQKSIASISLNTVHSLSNIYPLCLLTLPNHTIVAGCSSGQILIWNPNTGCYSLSEQPGQAIQSLCLVNNSVFAAGYSDGIIVLWDTERIHPVALLQGHTGSVMRMLSLDNNLFISCSRDNTMRLWNLTHNTSTILASHTDWVNDVILLSSGFYLSCSDDSTIKLWDPKTCQCIQTINTQGQIGTALLQLNEATVLLGTKTGIVQKLNTTTWKQDVSSISHSRSISRLVMIAENVIGAGSDDHTLKLWNEAGTYALSLAEHTGSINDVIIVDQSTMASCSTDGSIRLWKTDFQWPAKNNKTPRE